MNANLNISFDAINKIVVNILHRFHVVIFAILIGGGATAVIFILNNIVIRSADTSGYTPSSAYAPFDQDTINKIKNLKTSNQSGTDLDLSTGRVNPFIE
jgi:predicted class III extradiol MEMO1 family dioxygenase